MDQQDRVDEQETGGPDIRSIVREAIGEFVRLEQSKSEPAYKAELAVERQKREVLERKLNELADENRRSRAAAEEMERSSAIRSELQRLGVAKVDLAFRAIREDIHRASDGRLIAKTEDGEMHIREYLQKFVSENPEFLPSRIPGGTGVATGIRVNNNPAAIDLDKIRPGMSAEDLDRVRKEIAKIASQTLR
jgi:hypothetical protein